MCKTLFNAAALAEYLDCSVRHVRRLDRRGVLPRIEVGRLVRYDAEEVLRALKREALEGATDRVVFGFVDFQRVIPYPVTPCARR